MREPDREHSSGQQAEPDRDLLTGSGLPQTGDARPRGRRHRRGRVVLAATVAVLAVGGTAAYAASDGSGAGATTASPSASTSPDGPGARHGHPGRWLGPGAGVHGEATVRDRDSGAWVVRTWQRGTVTKVAGDQVTVRSDDGTSWTWTVAADTPVRGGGKGTDRSGADALPRAEAVLLVGTRADDGTRTATLVLTGDADHDGGRHAGPKGRAPEDRGPHDRHEGFRFRGPHGGGGSTASPAPSSGGATT
ncbi:hypothetical protein ACL02U_28380 [Streptomyces sp. MS06]|uniref:hypothetical protein n=1 Tax=Streptomyces sp. MS06 TaxID=3385974 RepID=UPI0039A12BF6